MVADQSSTFKPTVRRMSHALFDLSFTALVSGPAHDRDDSEVDPMDTNELNTFSTSYNLMS